MTQQPANLYEAIGGAGMIDRLVDAFYKHVAAHPDLAPIFPDDFTETARKQKQFLTQFLGGPPLYSKEHGHPMLRARHLKFPIGPVQETAWLSCMAIAMTEAEMPGHLREGIFSRLAMTAHHMVNLQDENR